MLDPNRPADVPGPRDHGNLHRAEPGGAARTLSGLPDGPCRTACDRGRGPDQALRRRARRRRAQLRRADRRHDRAARRQRRRQDHDDRDAARPARADRRPHHGARRGHAGPPLPRARADQFLLALCRPAAPPHGAPEPARLCRPVRHRGPGGADPRARRRSRSAAVARAPDRQALGRAKDPRDARQGADQPARAPAARRADRLARSRHRGRRAQLSRGLPAPRARDHAARLAQHGRGRAPVLGRADAQDRPPGRPGRARRAARRATAAPTSSRCSSTSRAPPRATGRWPASRTRAGERPPAPLAYGLAAAADLRPAGKAAKPAATHATSGTSHGCDQPPRARGAPDRRDDAPPSLPAEELLAAHPRARLLADRADDPLGLHHQVPGRPYRPVEPGGGPVPVRGPALGRAVPQPALGLAPVHGGDVVAPSRPSVRLAAPAARAGCVLVRDEPDSGS